MTVTTSADATPLNRQVVDTLRHEIEGGQPAVGERLATEEALCQRFGVSRHTIRDALRKLREEGLVASRQGAGTTVIRRGSQPLYVQSVSSVEELLQYATEARYEVDKSGMVVADAALARRLECAQGQRWLRVEGFRYVAGQAEPICWTEVFVLADYAGVGLRIGRGAGPIYSWIEEMYGVRISEIEQVLQAEPMPDAIGERLGAPPGATAIGIRRAYRLADRRLAEVAFNLHRSDRFTYAVTLKRKP
ncbi:MAG: GntR family transcriptional regulator [Rhodospirillales bacterium]|nr:GntR family transcriptional regulator [Rhodospirillales bacterium]